MLADAQKKRTRKTVPAKPKVAPAVPLPEPYREIFGNAQQMLLVTTPGWNRADGTLRRFEKQDGNWVAVGDRVAVVVGKNGVGWDGITDPPPGTGQPVKKEGDGRSPAGIFRITDLFGFAATMEAKLPYRELTKTVECVDDPSSQTYNQIVDKKDIPNPDWNSSEKMRTIDQYKIGAVVDYNSPKVPDAGSCIFLHIWKAAGQGTAGCTAMDEGRLQEILKWLDEKKSPVLVQLPVPLYERVKESWKLP